MMKCSYIFVSKCSYIFVSNKCSDLIVGQRQKSSQDKSRNKELTFFTECLTRQSLQNKTCLCQAQGQEPDMAFQRKYITISMIRYYQDQIDRSLDLGS